MEQIKKLKKLRQSQIDLKLIKEENEKNKLKKINEMLEYVKSNKLKMVNIYPYGTSCFVCDYYLENEIDYKKINENNNIEVSVYKSDNIILCKECYEECINKIENTF